MRSTWRLNECGFFCGRIQHSLVRESKLGRLRKLGLRYRVRNYASGRVGLNPMFRDARGHMMDCTIDIIIQPIANPNDVSGPNITRKSKSRSNSISRRQLVSVSVIPNWINHRHLSVRKKPLIDAQPASQPHHKVQTTNPNSLWT